jgi:serine/threonine-protein kinase RsbW
MTKTLLLAGGSRLPFIDRVTQAARTLLRDEGYPSEVAERVELAVAEAVANAIRHGNRGLASLRVEVRFESVADGLRVQVRDEGPGFDPTTLPDPRLPERRLVPSGRGVLLMRALMDEVEVVLQPQGGCVVHLSKRRHAVPPDTRQEYTPWPA